MEQLFLFWCDSSNLSDEWFAFNDEYGVKDIEFEVPLRRNSCHNFLWSGKMLKFTVYRLSVVVVCLRPFHCDGSFTRPVAGFIFRLRPVRHTSLAYIRLVLRIPTGFQR